MVFRFIGGVIRKKPACFCDGIGRAREWVRRSNAGETGAASRPSLRCFPVSGTLQGLGPPRRPADTFR